MGLADRVAQLRADAEARELVKKQAELLIQQQAEAAEQQAQASVAQKEADKIAKFSQALDDIDVRKILEDVRTNIWRMGIIDSKPTELYPDRDYPGKNDYYLRGGLFLRGRYLTYKDEYEHRGGDSGFWDQYTHSIIVSGEVRLGVAVELSQTSRMAVCVLYSEGEARRGLDDIRHPGSQVDVNNKVQSKILIEDQLADVLSRAKDPIIINRDTVKFLEQQIPWIDRIFGFKIGETFKNNAVPQSKTCYDR